MAESKSDILRKEIDEKIDQGIDMTNSRIREDYLADLSKRRPEFNIQKSRTLVLKITQERYRKINDILAITKLTRKPDYKFNVKMHEELTGQSLQRPKKQKRQTEKPQEPNQAIHEEQEPLPKPQKFTQRTIKYTHWTPERVGDVFQAFLLPFTRKYPELKLSKEQKLMVGHLWLPTFQMFGSEGMQFFGLPTLSSIGIISSKDSQKVSDKEEPINPEFYN